MVDYAVYICMNCDFRSCEKMKECPKCGNKAIYKGQQYKDSLDKVVELNGG